MPNNISKKYNVYFKDSSERGLRNIIIKGYNDNVIFEGQYGEGSPFLFDKYGIPLVGNEIAQVMLNRKAIYDNDYKISLKTVVDFAALANETTRGESGYLLIAMLIFALTLIDIWINLINNSSYLINR